MTANRKVTARYAEIARFLGLHFNEEFCVAYGEKDGFTLRVSGLDTGRGIEYGMVCISVGVAENGVKFKQDKQFRKEHQGYPGRGAGEAYGPDEPEAVYQGREDQRHPAGVPSGISGYAENGRLHQWMRALRRNEGDRRSLRGRQCDLSL